MAGHNACLLVFLVLSVVLFIATLVFNFFASYDVEMLNLDLFENSVGNISDKYPVEITPAGWTFTIWGAIYAYQLLMVLYILTLTCRSSSEGHLYHSPPFLGYGFFIHFSIACALNIAWVFVWDRELLLPAVVILFNLSSSLFWALQSTMTGLAKHKSTLIKEGKSSEIGLVIGFVHNAIGLYFGWTVVASFINLNVVFVHSSDSINLASPIASTVCLGGLGFVIVMYAVIDMVFFEPSFRFLFTPYISFCVGFAGIIEKNWDDENQNIILTVALVSVTGFLFISKIIKAIVKQRSSPIIADEMA